MFWWNCDLRRPPTQVDTPHPHSVLRLGLFVLWDNVDGVDGVHLDTFHDLNLRNCLHDRMKPRNCYVHDWILSAATSRAAMTWQTIASHPAENESDILRQLSAPQRMRDTVDDTRFRNLGSWDPIVSAKRARLLADMRAPASARRKTSTTLSMFCTRKKLRHLAASNGMWEPTVKASPTC